MPEQNNRSLAKSLLVPAWPPLSVSEALIYVLAAVGLRVLLDIWVPETQVLPLFDNSTDQAMMLLGQGLRWTVMALIFGLAARLALKLDPILALATGAFILVALCLDPVVGRAWPQLDFYTLVGIIGGLAAVMALVVGLALSRQPVRIAVYVLAVGILAMGGLTYMQRHAWLLDFVGFAVKGALIADRDEARRVFLLHLPPLLVFTVLWLVLGGIRARQTWYVVTREWSWLVFGFVALAALGGWIAGAVSESASLDAWLPSLFLPPAVYGVVGMVMTLALLSTIAASIRGRLRQRVSVLGIGDLVAMAGAAVVIAIGVAPVTLTALGAFALILLVMIWPTTALHRAVPMQLLGGGLLGLSAFAAGALALPDLDVARFVSDPLLLAVVFGGGAALAGFSEIVDEVTGRRPAISDHTRLIGAMWLVDYALALGVLVGLVGASSPLLWGMIGLGALVVLASYWFDYSFEHSTKVFVFALIWSLATVAATLILLLS